ncbi:Hypothetical predicted protein [Mytilus galloprovincialis]|nr:Hypothetical predicted protein [Mytilus galloprovincialis]
MASHDYEEPSPTHNDLHEYLEIVEWGNRTSRTPQISTRMYGNSTSPEKKNKSQKLFLCFMLGCVTSAILIVPLIIVFRQSTTLTEKENDKCMTETPCINNGHCVTYNNTVLCICPAGYIGNQCEIKDLCIISGNCHNGGTCITTRHSSYCICSEGFIGKNCKYRGLQGYQFFVAFNPKYRNITLHMSSEKSGRCDLSLPSVKRYKTVALRGNYTSFDLSKYDNLGIGKISGDAHIRVVCEVFIYLFYFLTDEYGAIWKSFHGIPSKGLSNEYVIPQFKPHQKFDALSVVAFEENTTVTVNFKTARWVLSNITFNESMFDDNKLTFNAAQYEYSYISCEQCHLTGTFVNGTRPFALFFKTYIPVVIPVLPLDDFSKVFIVPQLSSLIKTLGLRIFSKYKTKIEFKDNNNTISTSILDVNNYLTTNHKHTTVVSSQEEIILFMKAYSPHTGTIDSVVPGVNQYLPYYEFVVPRNTNENFATFILPLGEAPGIRLNNRQFELSQFSVVNVHVFDTVYSIFSISIKEGWHIAKHVDYVKFGLLIQGISNNQDKRHSSPYLYFTGRNLTVITNRSN